jgi:hypothetical protein
VSSSRFGSWHGQPIDADKLSRALAQMSILAFLSVAVRRGEQ